MERKELKAGGCKKAADTKPKENNGSIAYRLKCAKTANGLSHFAMYGDVPKEKTAL